MPGQAQAAAAALLLRHRFPPFPSRVQWPAWPTARTSGLLSTSSPQLQGRTHASTALATAGQ